MIEPVVTQEEKQTRPFAIFLAVGVSLYFLLVSLLLTVSLPFLFEEIPALKNNLVSWFVFLVLVGSLFGPHVVLIARSRLGKYWPFWIYGPALLLSIVGGSYLYFVLRIATEKM